MGKLVTRVNNGFADGSLDIQEFKEFKNPFVPKKVELEEQIAVLKRNKQIGLNPCETGFFCLFERRFEPA